MILKRSPLWINVANIIIKIMNLPSSSRLQLTPDLNICRILNGMWQVSGKHGAIDPTTAIQTMFDYIDAGFTTWDLADIYGPAEDFIGQFRHQLATNRGQEALSNIQAFTKWVPKPTPMTKEFVEEQINISRQRMGVETLDLLQFHCWRYQDNNYLDALKYLSELQEEGKIKHLGLTNFDTEHLHEIVEAGINIVSHQVQFSLIDRRPEVNMIPLCLQKNIKLLTYGTLCGGFLSEKFLGQPEPQAQQLSTASLKEYKIIIDKWGGWGLFQELLTVLSSIAAKHGVSISNIAVRYILDQPAVAGVIVGARLGISEHIKDNARVFNLQLDGEDSDRINAVLDKSHNLYELIGDCGDELR